MEHRPAVPRRPAWRRSVKRRCPTPGSPSGPPPDLWRYSAIGAEPFSPIIGGSVVGYYIDEHFQTASIWTLVGLLGGVFLGFYRLIAEVRSFRKNL
jgi:Putative F0F1-ATPase subunit Ca2+/Mg2+ transporter